MSSILVVGEALVDVVVHQDSSTQEHPGGSPLNVAIGLSRLGHEVELFTRIGRDDAGTSIRRHLDASGVTLAQGSLVDEPTSTATARLAADGSATYSFDLHWSLPHEQIIEISAGSEALLALHTGSIGAVMPPGGADVATLVAAVHGSVMVTYDPNLRPDLMRSPDAVRSGVEWLVARSDVVKLSDEDAAWLEPEEDPENLAQRWLRLGPSLVVLTKGGRGLVGWCAAGRVDVTAPEVDVADTVGAGDSAMAALIDALDRHGLLGAAARQALGEISEDVLDDVLSRAAVAAAVTVSRPGADPPDADELREALAR